MIAFEDLALGPHTLDDFERVAQALQAQGKQCELGCVVSLDRGYPLVRTNHDEVRAELATTMKKSDDSIVAIGDWVALCRPQDHEKAVIEQVVPRRNEIARVKHVGREGQMRRQVLAANVDIVLICQSLTGEGLDEGLLVRQMAAAAGCDATPVFVLTKSDLVSEASVDDARQRIGKIAPDVTLVVVSQDDPASIEELRSILAPKTTALLLGESGVGKSSLVNALLGQDALETGHVRVSDDKGRHTTVARKMVAVPHAGIIIDAPGLRTLQLLDPDKSIKRAFPDIADAALACRFRDCTHGDEPGCAVRDEIPFERLEAYRRLQSHVGF